MRQSLMERKSMFGLWMGFRLMAMQMRQLVVIFVGELQIVRKSMRFIKLLLPRVVKITVRRDCAPITTRIITVRS